MMLRKVLTIILVCLPVGFIAGSLLMVAVYRYIPVRTTPLMIKRAVLYGLKPKRIWMPIEDISPEMIAAVIAAEDNNFYSHNGFDFEEIARMSRHHLSEGTPIRGCSTISQQTAKNCFTWCTDTWIRKGIETYFTVLIEKLWGKERILEVYLNVAETGPGIYGFEAAARHYFSIPASELTMADASSLACCLPSPLHRTPDWVNTHMSSRRSMVALIAYKGDNLK
ncbi:MAG: monofunctional biosynthetic peptidoglycan transglycosylase [Bacteroidales bacterium]|nr:monofunctional biosynthetic peptidoglycan transglycosylase [Bacteroidales bacterium]